MTNSSRDFPDVLPKAGLRNPGRRLRGAVLQKMGKDIVSGRFAPGDTLPGEVGLAQEMQISRGAVREAMQVLAAKGLVESRPKCGTRILPRHRWNILDPDILAWAFAEKPDVDLVRDIFELRASIEPAAAALAAERRTKDDLVGLKDALSRMRQNRPADQPVRDADRDFHRAILVASGNNAMVQLSASISAAIGWTAQIKFNARALPRNAVPDHARVYDAIAAQDPNLARLAMEALIALNLKDTRSALAAL